MLESAAGAGCPVALTLKGSGTRTGNATTLYRLLSNEQSSLQDMTDQDFHMYRYREGGIISSTTSDYFFIYLGFLKHRFLFILKKNVT